MAISEVFPNPTVKQVIFQIRFPNLFYMESRIGDLQLKIMKMFPKSALRFRRQVLFADIGPEGRLERVPEGLDSELGKRVWNFKSDKDFELNVLSNSLDITSRHHKTYNLEGGDRFREVIAFVVDSFIEVTSIPIMTRIGLRYIDECPIPAMQNDAFLSYYRSTFPLDRFNLADAKEMRFQTVVKTGEYCMRYVEALAPTDDEYSLILDFDGFAENIDARDYLQVTDDLHTIILNEFERTIREPVIEYMRSQREE